jgi:Ca-activated chloride channel family protein
LIERPITDADSSSSLAAAPESTRFALAVAGFGQRLRGDPWMKSGFGWGDIAKVADRSRSYDPDGLRAQFVNLVNRAGDTGSASD